MTTTREAVEQLTGPGGPFEIVREDVGGVELQVYKNRMGSMRDLITLAEGHDGKAWVIQGEERFTFAEHNARVRALARAFGAAGIGRGDRVALVGANSPEWVITFWACAAASAVCVPLNAWWKAEELEFALRDSGAKALVCDQRRHDLLRDVLADLPDLEHVWVLNDAAYTALLNGEDPGSLPDVPVAEDDISGIFYTSGTTGKPKGATVTHRQVVANLQNIMVAGIAATMAGGAPPAEMAGADKPQAGSLLVVPLFHTTGCHATMVLNYAAGSKLVLMPPGRFDPDVAMQIIQDEKLSSIGGVPTIMWRIVESPRLGEFDLSSVSRIAYGGAPAAPELVERITEVFPNARSGLSTAYGLTETASVATAVSGEDYIAHPGSAGRPVPTVELRIVDIEGRDMPPGAAGEIWLKGPTISSHGYWNRPDANAESFTDGWFHTGDVGKLDEEGYLYIVDRAKDMIIRGGENIYSVEIENVLYEHPDIIDAAVVGVPHKMLGEEVKAVVQVKEGASLTEHDVKAFAAEHLANFKVPEYVEIVREPLPRNPAGKVLKSALRGTTTSFGAESSDSAL